MSEKYYVVEAEFLPLDDTDGKIRERVTHRAGSKINAINAVLYHTRGRRSQHELAHVVNVWGPFDSKDEAREKQYE